MSLPVWLELALRFAPMVLGAIPKTAPIAGHVADAIMIAEQIPGLDGAGKKAKVMQLASAAIQSVNAEGGSLDEGETLAAVDGAIDTTVHVINTVHAAQAVPEGVILPPTTPSV